MCADPRRQSSRLWHDSGMSRIRLSTTVDATLLEHARELRSWSTDAALVDEALTALLARKEPIEQCRANPTDVEYTGRARRESDPDLTHKMILRRWRNGRYL